MSKKGSNPPPPDGVTKPSPPPAPPEIKEGTMKKGGWNERPTSKRPSPPKGQGGIVVKVNAPIREISFECTVKVVN